MALASFPDGSYLELIAIQPKADPGRFGRALLAQIHGSRRRSVRLGDSAGGFSRRSRAIAQGRCCRDDPRRAGRKRPDGVELDWETAQVGPTNGGFFPFLIHDFTPRDNRAFPSGKPTTTEFTGVVKVVIGVRDLGRCDRAVPTGIWFARARRARRYRLRREARVFSWNAGRAGDPALVESWLSVVCSQFGDAPCAFVLGTATGVSIAVGRFSRIRWLDSSKLGWHLGFESNEALALLLVLASSALSSTPNRSRDRSRNRQNQNHRQSCASGAARCRRHRLRRPPGGAHGPVHRASPHPRRIAAGRRSLASTVWTSSAKLDRSEARRLSQLGSRPTRHRDHARQSRRDGPGPRAAAIPLGTFRRRFDVPARQHGLASKNSDRKAFFER